jgi:hypothetical protein
MTNNKKVSILKSDWKSKQVMCRDCPLRDVCNADRGPFYAWAKDCPLANLVYTRHEDLKVLNI